MSQTWIFTNTLFDMSQFIAVACFKSSSSLVWMVFVAVITIVLFEAGFVFRIP